jgi:hypothetical protein
MRDIVLFISFSLSLTLCLIMGVILRNNRKKVKRMFEELEKELKQEIGKRLKKVRKERGWTLQRMAVEYSKHRGISPPIEHSTIQYYELESAPYHYILWIHSQFKISLEWLLLGDRP